jgi:UDP-N-acetylmuramoylalanine--D-glutamate ligase
VRDKLSLTRLEGEHVTLVANDPAILIEREQIGGILKITEPAPASLTQALRLRGVHNQRNLGLAIGIAAAVSGRGDLEIIDAIRRHASDYVALEGRLATVRELDGVSFIDDGLATAPLPTVAALDVFADEPVSLIVGGFDRGVEYDSLVEAVVQRTSPTTVIVMPEVGHRIGELLRERGVVTVACDDMDLAVALARSAVATGGVVLLSPAAPSFGRYTNWRERSADFRRAVGELS